MNLLIPIPLSQENKPVTVVAKKTVDGKSQTSRPEKITYVIKKGDTLWSIANEMGVNIGALSRWNNLHPEKKLAPGTKLKIMLNSDGPSSKGAKKESEGRKVLYRVREGDTLWGIAKKYNLTIADIKTWNRLDIDRICPEDQLTLRVDGTRSSILD
ncbi:MAG: LysM peptidoglycan-binding domain-containing protein, partial [Deltaproteobacteria bacterium]